MKQFIVGFLLGALFLAHNANAGLAGCDVKLENLGHDLMVTAEDMAKIAPFKKVLSEVTAKYDVSYKIPGLSTNAPITAPRARQIVKQLLDPNSELTKAFGAHLVELGGIQSPALWDLYFRSYDKIVAYSDGYLKLGVMAHKVLPKDGQIGDFGAGTGNVTGILISQADGRHVVATDISPKGLAVAEKKVELLTGGDGTRLETKVLDLKTAKLVDASLDGAVMNNVLYTLQKTVVDGVEVDYKYEVLKKVFDSLKAGGTFVLNDPTNSIKRDGAKLEAFLVGVALSAIKNGAPISEYEMALVGAINIQILMGPKDIFMAPEDLKALVQKVGFHIHGWYTGYYGASTFLVLQKP